MEIKLKRKRKTDEKSDLSWNVWMCVEWEKNRFENWFIFVYWM